MNAGRTEKYERDGNLESVLGELNAALASIPENRSLQPDYPLLLIMGCPRSGSTLFLQWLAALDQFGYPSNLIARFFGNPRIGVLAEKALIDYDTKNQIGLHGDLGEHRSDLGRTIGAKVPSEFWYFWRRFFDFGEIQTLSDAELDAVDWSGFLSELASMEVAFGKPVAMKGMIMNWHVPTLSSQFDKFVFVNLKRDLFFVAQSMYLARKDFFGDCQRWWSYKPPEYNSLTQLSPIEQVAAQAVYTQKAVDEGMSQVPPSRRLDVDYESFCQCPGDVYRRIRECFSGLGYDLGDEYFGEGSFRVSNTVRLSDQEEVDLKAALARYCELADL